MSNCCNAFLYTPTHYLHLHIIAYESIHHKKMPLIYRNPQEHFDFANQIYKLRFVHYWHHLQNLIQLHLGNRIVTLIRLSLLKLLQ